MYRSIYLEAIICGALNDDLVDQGRDRSNIVGKTDILLAWPGDSRS